MWYLIWFLGTMLAASLAVITGLWIDKKDNDE